MIAFLKKYAEKHFDLSSALEMGIEKKEIPPPKKASSVQKWKIRILRLIPYICSLLFIGSLFWDFSQEHQIKLFGFAFSLENLLKTIAVSGLIGYGTNWLAIKMLFKPQEKRPVWGQGLIPATKDRLIHKLSSAINDTILNRDQLKLLVLNSGVADKVTQALVQGAVNLFRDEEFKNEVINWLYLNVKEYFKNPKVRKKIIQELDAKINVAVGGGVGGFVYKSYKSLNREKYNQRLEDIVNEIPEIVLNLLEHSDIIIDEIVDTFQKSEEDLRKLLTQVIVDLIERIQVYDIVRNQLEDFDEGKLEEMIWTATNEHLLYIQYLGGLLGVLGGLLLWQPYLMLSVYSLLGISLWLLDNFLYRLKKKRNVSLTERVGNQI